MREEAEFSFEHVHCEMPIRSSSGKCRLDNLIRESGFSERPQNRDVSLDRISLQIVFKTCQRYSLKYK